MKVVCFGEIMMRLNPEGYRRFVQADTFEANANAFTQKLDGLQSSLADIKTAHAGEGVFVTEPVPGYMVEAAGMENVTPSEFSEAVEEGQDVPPATLLTALDLIGSGKVQLVIVNSQAAGAETTQAMDAAKSDISEELENGLKALAAIEEATDD
jgi:zinc/manganese transport system substrate-binding protein